MGTSTNLKRLGEPARPADQGALSCCGTAADFILKGQFEEACEALGGLWQGVGERPRLGDLGPQARAELLLRCGTLTGWLGSCKRLPGAQESAKDLLNEAVRLFERLALPARTAEARYELGVCYWRTGAFDEARIMLGEALHALGPADVELRARVHIGRTIVEINARRYHEAWEILRESEPAFESVGDVLKGRWHGERALVLKRLAAAENRADYADRAILEFTAAIFHYEQAGHERYCASNLNNLGLLLYALGRHAEAHENLDRARSIFARLGDAGSVAQVDETRARVLIAEGRFADALKVITGAARSLEEAGEQALLADALTVAGMALARLGRGEESVATLRRAMEVAERASAPAIAGVAGLALIETHADELPAEELYDLYRRADDLLAHTQDSEDIARLRAAARVVTCRLAGVELGGRFSLPEALRAYESKFIERALEEERGSVSRAAKRLGIKHQSLAHILRTRQTGLLGHRTPVIPRRRVDRGGGCSGGVRAVSILHVEDQEMVADAVRDTLEAEGWGVVTCADGALAVDLIEGAAGYDLLVFDNHLPNVNGMELVRRARRQPHRGRTPIIMLSAGDLSAEALAAGADAFLAKPDGVRELVGEVARLLARKQL
ncbi:MAG TPA: response regulator [Pyrinomonadaceae bacterium]|nr:response regulator [Pyrinomonadaceae bacterium]